MHALRMCICTASYRLRQKHASDRAMCAHRGNAFYMPCVGPPYTLNLDPEARV